MQQRVWFVSLVVIFLFAVMRPVLHGQEIRVWNGLGADDNWSTPGNWSDDQIPGETDTARFDGTSSSNAVIDPGYAGTIGDIDVRPEYGGTIRLNRDLTVTNHFLLAGTNATAAFTWTVDQKADLYIGGDLTISNTAIMLVCRSSTEGQGQGQTITVGGSVLIEEDATLSAVAQGFDARQGPGYSGDDTTGAAHGGQGGYRIGRGILQDPYGCSTNPVSLGSGNRGAGGGAIRLVAGTSVNVKGTLTADGFRGAGGSINIETPLLEGTGSIRANGGSDNNRSGSGGGRIAFNAVTNDSFSGSIEAAGGTGPSTTSARDARSGTIWLSEPRREHLYLGPGGMTSLQLGYDGSNNLAFVFGTVEIDDGGILEIGGYATYAVDGNGNFTGTGRGPVLMVDELLVRTNGLLSADRLGFPGEWGPGYVGDREKGATHGGMGGYDDAESTDNLRLPYGSIDNPQTFGSGSSHWGGGALIIHSKGTVLADGMISASGYVFIYGRGGSAGGSVNMTAPALAGNGVIRAIGGDSIMGSYHWDSRGKGGGGRIAVLLTNSADIGNVELLAHGGHGAGNHHGAAGTIFLHTPDDLPTGGSVLIDNSGIETTTNSYTTLPGIDAIPHADLRIGNTGTRVKLVENARSMSLTLDADVVFDLNHQTMETYQLEIDGQTYGAGSYRATDLGAAVTDDPAGNGRIVVIARGTLFKVR